MSWNSSDRPMVYVVIERRGDGYHTYDPELLKVYFEERLAREHASKKPEYDYEAVPLGPQVIEYKED